MIKVGIVGGAGYTAGELLRILLHHPNVAITFVNSSSNDGKLVSDVHKDLIGETSLVFNAIDFATVDIIFLCMGHGKSKSFVQQHNIPSQVKIIDLSNDYRLQADADDFVYGLPEAYREEIKKANYIANPGCFATGIQLAILPLAQAHLLTDDIHVNGITGSTGAGQQPSETSHFSWRNGNISAYKIFDHQHLGEINQTVKDLQKGFSHRINFIPIRGNHTRGIYVTAYTKSTLTLEQAYQLYQTYYDTHPFVHITKQHPDLKQVVNTNKCVLSLEKNGDILLVISVTDNLIKGASGQAVQNMNLMFGLDEKTGLNLKSVGF